jgi:branched-chain amino acid transport system substrate-binding protein
MLRRRTFGALGGAFGVSALAGVHGARAETGIKIGAIISITGPTAAQGVGYRNAFDLFPAQIAGVPVTYIVRDDGGDPTAAVNIANKMITEDKVDAFIGPSLTSSDMANLPVMNGAKVPMIAMAPISFDAQKYPYTFDDAQPAALMVDACAQHMKKNGAKTVGFIGYGDGWGDEVWNGLKLAAAKYGIEIVVEERYARTDTSVQAQVLRAMTKHPDVMMLGGSAVPGALPNIALTQRGYKGQIYNNHGSVSPEYIRVGGAAVEGCIAPTGPLVVYDQLPDSNPIKPVATKFMTDAIAKFGPAGRSPFAGYSYDAFLLISNAVPVALKKAQPGTPEFRVALRDAIEQTRDLVGTHGVYNMSPTDHHGVDERARVLVQVQNGAWKLIPG